MVGLLVDWLIQCMRRQFFFIFFRLDCNKFSKANIMWNFMTLNSFRFTFSITFIAFVSPKTFNQMVHYSTVRHDAELPRPHRSRSCKTATTADAIFIYLTTVCSVNNFQLCSALLCCAMSVCIRDCMRVCVMGLPLAVFFFHAAWILFSVISCANFFVFQPKKNTRARQPIQEIEMVLRPLLLPLSGAQNVMLIQ